MQATQNNNIMILGGSSHPDLVQLIARRLHMNAAKVVSYHKPNRETVVQIGESMRGKDVYIIETGTKDVNNDVMELLIMTYACKTSSARRVIGVVPYLPYCKQSKMRKRGCIVSKLVAKMLCKAGMEHLITMDLHSKEIQGFFDCPVDNLRASAFLLNYIEKNIPDYKNAVIVARNPNAVNRATSYAERLRVAIAVIHGETKAALEESEMTDGRSSPPLNEPLHDGGGGSTSEGASSSNEVDYFRAPDMVSSISSGVPGLVAKEKPPLSVVGDVGGKLAIIVDNMIDEVSTFIAAAEVLKARGAYKIFVMATHGLLSSDAPRLLEESYIDEVIVTNTVPHDIQKLQCAKIRTVDVSVMLSEAIRRIHFNESMSYLFEKISTED